MKQLLLSLLMCLTLVSPVFSQPIGGGMIGGESPFKNDIIAKSPWVDARYYGAKGDGITDDTAAFNLAGATGYPVFVLNGTYKITTDITVVGMYGASGRLPVIKLYTGASIIISGGETNLYTPFHNLDIQPQASNTKSVDIRRQMVYSRGIRIYGDNTKTGCTGLYFNVDAASQAFHDFDDFQILDVHKPIHIYDTGTGYFISNKVGSLNCQIHAGVLANVSAITVELNTANQASQNRFGAYIDSCLNVVEFKKAFSGNTFDVHLDGTTYLEKLAVENAGNKFVLTTEIETWIDPAGGIATNYGNDNIYSLKGSMGHVYSVSSGSQYIGIQDGLVLANATTGDQTIYLPDSVAAAGKGKIIRVIKTDSSANTVIITPDGADTINGRTTLVLSSSYESVTLMGGGGNWVILSWGPAYGTTGGIKKLIAEATANIEGDTSTTITFDPVIPTNVRLLGVQFRVDAALAAGETWDATYSGGSTTALVSAGAVAKSTKVNKMHVDEITSDVTNIAITKNGGGSFTAQGTIRAIVYYETFATMADAP